MEKNIGPKKGFSLIEVLVTMTLFLVMASVGVGSYFKYYSYSISNNDFNQVAKILRETRFKAMKNPYNSNYGVHLNIATSELTRYRDSYSQGNSENIVVQLQNLNIANLNLEPSPSVTNTILFENRTGKTQNSGTFDIVGDNFDYTYTINLQGAID